MRLSVRDALEQDKPLRLFWVQGPRVSGMLSIQIFEFSGLDQAQQ